MQKSPNWFVKNIRLIVTVIALYPWLLVLLMMMGSGGASGSARGARRVSVFFFLLKSINNKVISTVIIVVVNVSTPPIPKGSAKYFLAMNSISLLWLMLLLVS